MSSSEHFEYKELPNDGVMKINLHLDSSLVSLYYSPNNDSKPVLLMDKGELTPVNTALLLVSCCPACFNSHSHAFVSLACSARRAVH